MTTKKIKRHNVVSSEMETREDFAEKLEVDEITADKAEQDRGSQSRGVLSRAEEKEVQSTTQALLPSHRRDLVFSSSSNYFENERRERQRRERRERWERWERWVRGETTETKAARERRERKELEYYKLRKRYQLLRIQVCLCSAFIYYYFNRYKDPY